MPATVDPQDRRWGMGTKATVSLARKPDDSPDYLIIIVADISREKEIETALEESNQLLEAVIEELPAMIFLKRGRSALHGPQSAAEQLPVIRRPSWLARPTTTFSPKSADFFTRIDCEVLASEEPRERSKKNRSRLARHAVLEHAQNYSSKCKRRTQFIFVGVSIDITERKKAEALNRGIQALPEQIAVIEGEGRIVAVNGAWSKFAGAGEIYLYFLLSGGGQLSRSVPKVGCGGD